MSYLLTLAVSGYQLAPLPTPAHTAVRATRPAMEYRLNNFALPGPLSAIGDKVLVEMKKAKERSTGGLFLAPSTTEKAREGVVVSAGPGKHHPETGILLPCPVSVGDSVMMTDFGGEKLNYCERVHTMISSEEILGCYDGGVDSAEAFKPTGDRLLIKLEEEMRETASGITLAPGGGEMEDSKGQVVAVGTGLVSPHGVTMPVDVVVGDRVMFDKYAGSPVSWGEANYKIIRVGDCYAKF